MTINEAQDEVIEEFNDFTDWMDKYQLLIDLGGELNALGEQYKNDDNLIEPATQTTAQKRCTHRKRHYCITNQGT